MYDKKSYGDFSADMEVVQFEQSTLSVVRWKEPEPINAIGQSSYDNYGAPKYGRAQIWRDDVKDFDISNISGEQEGAAVDWWMYFDPSVYPLWGVADHEKSELAVDWDGLLRGTQVNYNQSLKFTLKLWLYFQDTPTTFLVNYVADTYTYYQPKQSASWSSELRKILFIPFQYKRNKDKS